MGSPTPNDFWLTQMQRELDRRFTDVKEEMNRRFTSTNEDMNRRFTDVDKDNGEIKRRLDKLEGASKDNFRTYVTPIIVAVATAIIIAILVRNGVVVSQ